MEENPWLRRYRPKIDFIHTGIIELPTALSASRGMKQVNNPRDKVITVVPMKSNFKRKQKV